MGLLAELPSPRAPSGWGAEAGLKLDANATPLELGKCCRAPASKLGPPASATGAPERGEEPSVVVERLGQSAARRLRRGHRSGGAGYVGATARK